MFNLYDNATLLVISRFIIYVLFEVDEIVTEFCDINRGMEGIETLKMKQKRSIN